MGHYNFISSVDKKWNLCSRPDMKHEMLALFQDYIQISLTKLNFRVVLQDGTNRGLNSFGDCERCLQRELFEYSREGCEWFSGVHLDSPGIQSG